MNVRFTSLCLSGLYLVEQHLHAHGQARVGDEQVMVHPTEKPEPEGACNCRPQRAHLGSPAPVVGLLLSRLVQVLCVQGGQAEVNYGSGQVRVGVQGTPELDSQLLQVLHTITT